MTLSHTLSCIVSPGEKEKKRNINNDLAVLPSHNTFIPSFSSFSLFSATLLLNNPSGPLCFVPGICTNLKSNIEIAVIHQFIAAFGYKSDLFSISLMYCTSTFMTNSFASINQSFVAFRTQNKPYNSNFDCEYLKIHLFHVIDPNLADCHCPSASSCTKMNPTAITDVSTDKITLNGIAWSIGWIAS